MSRIPQGLVYGKIFLQLLTVLLLTGFERSWGQTNFYANSSGNVNLLSNWGTATDGSGTPPASFVANDQIFNIRNSVSPTISSNWTVSGTNSKIIVGDGTNPINFTIPNTRSVTGLIDVSAAATLTNSGGSALTLGSVSATSTIIYNQGSAQTIAPATYGNLVLAGSGTKTMGGNVTVLRTLTLNNGLSLLISPGTLLTLSGNLINIGGSISGSSTSSLTLNSAIGMNVALPSVSLQNVTIQPADTIVLSGDLNLNGTLLINGTFDAGISEYQVKQGGSGTVVIFGKFITRDIDGFSGANASIPTIGVTINPGSTVEYGRAAGQQVTSRNDYKNITFSGSGIKTLATFRPIGAVTIKDNAVVDASNKTFGDTTATNLTMISGRFIVGGISTKPDIAGTYTLTGGVIEFAGGTISSRQNIRSSPTYLNIEVTGINVGNSNSSTKLAAGGSFTVKTGGSYENSGDKIDGPAGIQTFAMEAGSTFKTGMPGGFSGSTTAAVNNVETINIDPKSTIIYSRLGDQTITPLLSGYPNLLLKGSGIKSVSGGTLTIAPAADSVVIDPLVVFKVTTGAKADFNNRAVTVHSNTSGTGMVGEITDGSSALLNATNVTVERYIPARRAFRFITSPVTTPASIKLNWMEGQNNPPPAYSVNNNNLPGYGTHITGSANPADGFDVTATNNPSLFTFNNTSQLWAPVPNTNIKLTAGLGYRLLVRGSRSVDLRNNAATPSATILRANGALQVGTVVYNSGSNPSINATPNAFSLAGNPYASSIDWDGLLKQGLSPYYNVWDPTLNTRGAYATYGNGITSPAISQVDANIQGGQAFFVQAKSATPSLTFTEANKTSINKNVFRKQSAATSLAVQLLLNNVEESGSVADGVTILFDDNYAASIANEDAAKVTNLDENMSIASNSAFLSIEGRPLVVNRDTVQLSILQFRQKSYYFQFYPANFSQVVTILLRDNYLKTETFVDPYSTTLHPFTITGDSASFEPDRFSILFTQDNVLPITLQNVKAFKKGAGIQVEWMVETESGIKRYEVEKLLNDGEFEKMAILAAVENRGFTASYNWFDAVANTGSNCYRIKCIERSGSVTYSNQVCVSIGSGKSSVTIFPNPVKGSVFNLSMKNVPEGIYSTTIFDAVGSQVYEGFITHSGTFGHYKISIGKVIRKGTYLLRVSNADDTYVETLLFK